MECALMYHICCVYLHLSSRLSPYVTMTSVNPHSYCSMLFNVPECYIIIQPHHQPTSPLAPLPAPPLHPNCVCHVGTETNLEKEGNRHGYGGGNPKGRRIGTRELGKFRRRKSSVIEWLTEAVTEKKTTNGIYLCNPFHYCDEFPMR